MKNKAKPRSKNPLSVASKNEGAKALHLLNPKREELTPSILKLFPAYQHLSDSEAEETCASIQTLARLLLTHFLAAQNSISIDNQHVISLESSSETKIVPITRKNEKGKAA